MPKINEIKKRITISDVAEAAGVTKSTVSLALADKGNFSPKTRSAIKRVARRLNYEPNPHARRLSTRRFDKTVALFTLSLDLSVATKKLQLLQSLLVSAGFEAPLHASGCGVHATPPEQMTLMKTLCRQQPRAIVCNVHNLVPDVLSELERYQSEGGYVVCYDYYADLAVDKVLFDREDNTYQAVRHLLELGHRDIAIATSGGPVGARLAGFLRALEEFGIVPRDEWLMGSEVIDNVGIHSGLYELGGVRLAADFLKLKKRPTAVCLLDDYTAVGFAAELGRAGVRVPQDVSVVGHDDSPIARYGHLLLTTVTHPVAEIANNVMELLQSRMDGYEGPPREITVRGKLVVRQSTMPCNGLPNTETQTPIPIGV